MDAVKFLRAKKMMCEKFSKSDCNKCPLSFNNNGTLIGCASLDYEYPEKEVEIVEAWEKEHPEKTYKDDFLEKFPKASLCSGGHPPICRKLIYGGIEDGCSNVCKACWNEPMEV